MTLLSLFAHSKLPPTQLQFLLEIVLHLCHFPHTPQFYLQYQTPFPFKLPHRNYKEKKKKSGNEEAFRRICLAHNFCEVAVF